jgi:hypothetical protein
MEPTPELSTEEWNSALFASLVVQQTNLALISLGKTAHPETGEKTRDLDAARMFIDTLGMLEGKTKGNLTPEEQHLLQRSLTNLRMLFVEAANAAPEETTPGAPAPSAEPAKPAAEPAAGSAAGPAADDSRKKFVKKY